MNIFNEQEIYLVFNTSNPQHQVALKSSISLSKFKFINKLIQHKADDLEIFSGISSKLDLPQTWTGNLKIQKSTKGTSKLLLKALLSKESYSFAALCKYQVLSQTHGLRSKPQLGVSLQTEKVYLNLKLNQNPFIMSMALTSQISPFSFGGALKLALHSQKYTKYSLIFQVSHKSSLISIKHITKGVCFGSFYLSYLLRLGENTKFASVLRTSLDKRITEGKFGFEHVKDQNVFKSHINSSGRLALSLSRSVNKYFTGTISADVDLKEATSSKAGDYNIGLLVKFNYEE